MRGVDNVGGGGAKVGRVDIGGGVISDFFGACGAFTKGGSTTRFAAVARAGLFNKRDGVTGRGGGGVRVDAGGWIVLERVVKAGCDGLTAPGNASVGKVTGRLTGGVGALAFELKLGTA